MISIRFSIVAIVLLSFSLSSYSTTIAKGHSLGHGYTLQEIASGFGTIWGMGFLSNELLLFTERNGNLKLIDLSTGKVNKIQGLPAIYSEGQGGLLDVKKSPDYAETGWVYITYSKPNNDDGATTLARAKLANDTLTNWQDLLVTQASNNTKRHYGSRITFDNKGHLYFTIGDRGHRPNGQNLSTHAATVIRLNLDGSIPKDNPFIGDPSALDEIWSYGHRNPQGIDFDVKTQQLWSVEHGPRGGDEINLIKKAHNYGWPLVSQGKEYWAPLNVGSKENQPGMMEPTKVYIPSIAPSSLLVYRGSAFPKWQGVLFIGALALQHLNVVEVSDSGEALSETRLFESLNERIRNVIEGPDGFIYLATDSGRILMMRPSASTQ